MPKYRFHGLAALVAVFALIAAACSNDTTSPAAGTSGSTGTGVCASVDTSGSDALANICKSGTVRVATDAKYKPASWYDVKDGSWNGFDVDVAREIAKRLGVNVDLQAQKWDVITAGSWNDRWDLSVGSMTDTVAREKLFDFTPAYYYTPAGIAVNEANTSVQDISTDLDGKKICVGVATTYQDYLKKTLVLGKSAPPFDFQIDNATIETFGTDTDALDALALGDGIRCDAVASAVPIEQAYIDDGGPVKLVGDPIYFEPLSIAIDKNAPVDETSLDDAISKIVTDMHNDGTLSSLSQQWWHTDLTTSSGG